MYEEFKEQLTRYPGGGARLASLGRVITPLLPNNKATSLQRLNSLVRKLEKQGTLEQYDKIITTTTEENQTYAKQQLGVKQGETKLLGLTWNKEQDNIQVGTFRTKQQIAPKDVY